VIASLLAKDVECATAACATLASFGAATIATTHRFCQTVLRSLGVAGDTDTSAALVESLDDLVVRWRSTTSPAPDTGRTTRRSVVRSP
jgi:ATP-dependent exoDNAse (exonuclease V) beta subunit